MKKPLVIYDDTKASLDRIFGVSQGMPMNPSRFWVLIPKKAINLPDYIEGKAKKLIQEYPNRSVEVLMERKFAKCKGLLDE